jgi:CheY-like chemotaxis protein
VKIYFPRFTGRAADQSDEPPQSVTEGAQDETILIVEDDGELREYIAEVLRGLNYRVFAAANAEAALAFINQAWLRLDLMLTDVVMPGMNGRQLADRVKELRPSLAIVYMTGYSRNAIVHHGRLDEGVEILQKPISQSELAAGVRKVLDRRASR